MYSHERIFIFALLLLNMVCYTNMEYADLRECVNLNEGWIGFLHFLEYAYYLVFKMK